MRHYKKGRKLGTDSSHTKAMKRSLVCALFENDRIKTLEGRAKEIRGDVDRIITWAKKGDLHSRRLAIAALGGNKDLVREIFEKVDKGMFKGRQGGYTRILKLGYRKGDNAPVVIMELVTEDVAKKSKAKPASKPKATPKDEPKEQPKDEPKDESKEAPKEESKDEPKEEPKADQKDEPKADSQEDSEADSKEEPKDQPAEDPQEDSKEDSEDKAEDQPEK